MCARGVVAGHAVDVGDLAIHLLDGAFVGVFGDADARGVAVGFFGQAADQDAG